MSYEDVENEYDLANIYDSTNFSHVTTSAGNRCFMLGKDEYCTNLVLFYEFNDEDRVCKVKCVIGCVGYELVDVDLFQSTIHVLDSLNVICFDKFELPESLDGEFRMQIERDDMFEEITIVQDNWLCIEYIVTLINSPCL